MLQIRESEKHLFRRAPVKRTHREIAVYTLANDQLFHEILKRIKLMRSIKILVVLAVTAFNFTVVSGSKGVDFLVLDAKLSQSLFKQGRWLLFAVTHFIGELKAIVGLDAFDCIRELFYNMPKKLRGRIGAVFLKGLQIPKLAVFIKGGVLIPLCACFLSNYTGRRNELHINLYTLTRVLHLLIGLWNVLWVGQFDRLCVEPAE